MKTSIVTTRLFGENIYIIWDENTLEAAIIDPGMMDENERQEVEDVVKQEKLCVKYVLLTHSHIDHACQHPLVVYSKSSLLRCGREWQLLESCHCQG